MYLNTNTVGYFVFWKYTKYIWNLAIQWSNIIKACLHQER